MGQGFQYVPGAGLVPLGESVPTSSAPQAPVAVTAPPREPESPAKPAIAVRFDPTHPMTGGELLAVAKARVKEIDRQLRAMPILQSERAQLSSLIIAAESARPKRTRKVQPH